MFETFVGVLEPNTGTESSRIDNTLVVTSQGQVKRQQIGVADPEDPDMRAKVTDATPAADAKGLVTRVAGSVAIVDATVSGTANYDSGLQSIPVGLTDLAVADRWVSVLVLINITGIIQPISVTDNAGAAYVGPNRNLQPFEVLILPFGGVKFAGGVKWGAQNAASVNGQIKGRQ